MPTTNPHSWFARVISTSVRRRAWTFSSVTSASFGIGAQAIEQRVDRLRARRPRGDPPRGASSWLASRTRRPPEKVAAELLREDLGVGPGDLRSSPARASSPRSGRRRSRPRRSRALWIATSAAIVESSPPDRPRTSLGLSDRLPSGSPARCSGSRRSPNTDWPSVAGVRRDERVRRHPRASAPPGRRAGAENGIASVGAAVLAAAVAEGGRAGPLADQAARDRRPR